MMKHESLKLITFRTEESTEESKKSTENRRRMDGRARTLLKFELKLSGGLGEEEAGRYI